MSDPLPVSACSIGSPGLSALPRPGNREGIVVVISVICGSHLGPKQGRAPEAAFCSSGQFRAIVTNPDVHMLATPPYRTGCLGDLAALGWRQNRAGAQMTKAMLLAEGLYFGEGPRWRNDRLWFSDFYDHAVKSLDASGTVQTEFEIEDQPSGLGWLPDGRLLVVAMHRRQLLRVDPDGVKLHADLSAVAAHHTNDMVVDAAGRAYVGNFGFRWMPNSRRAVSKA